jgi:hypothetical protein
MCSSTVFGREEPDGPRVTSNESSRPLCARREEQLFDAERARGYGPARKRSPGAAPREAYRQAQTARPLEVAFKCVGAPTPLRTRGAMRLQICRSYQTTIALG